MVIRGILYLVFLWFCILCASAQNIQIAPIPALEQLPLNAVHRIFQDREGYIWFATSNGLCRYDGYSVKTFRSDTEHPNRMGNSDITVLTEDNNGNIWFGTYRGAYILDKRTYEIRPVPDQRLRGVQIMRMNMTADGTVWICVTGSLLRFDADEKLVGEYSLVIDGVSRYIDQLSEDRDGRLFVSIRGIGMYQLNTDTGDLTLFTDTDPYRSIKTCFLQDRDTSFYWLGTADRGIIRFDPNALGDSRYISQPLPVNSAGETDPAVYRIVQDEVYGYLWVTGLTDLFVFEITDNGMLKQVDTSSFMPQSNKMINGVVPDKDGNLWGACYDRESFVIRFPRHVITEYSLSALRQYMNGNPAITNLCRDESGLFWLVQERTGLCLYDAADESIRYYSEYPELAKLRLNNVSLIQKSQTPHRIWVATYGKDIFELEQVNGDMRLTRRLRLTDADPQAGTPESLHENAEGNLIVGTTTGLYIYNVDDKRWRRNREIDEIISGIAETPGGVLWLISEQNGIFSISPHESVKHFPMDSELLCVDMDSEEKLWLGTGDGRVLYFDPAAETVQDYSTASGMNGDRINHILVDELNHVWIGTYQKITEFNPRNGSFRNYRTSDDEVSLNRFLARSAFEGLDGTLYFGGINGFISVQPSADLESIPQQVHTMITDVRIMGKSLWLDGGINAESHSIVRIGPKDQNLEICFSSFDMVNASKIRYAYRLKGIDQEWNYIGDGKNSAFYNRLTKGKYVFEVKATDVNGQWSDRVTRMEIIRLPAWYESGWAYLLYVLIGGSILAAMIYLYLQRLKHANQKRFTEQVTQMKLRYFTNISHDLMTPLTIISCVADEMPEQPQTTLLRSNVARLKRLFQQVLDFRKVESGNMKLHITYGEVVAFIRDIYESSFTLLARQKNISFEFHAEPEQIEGCFDRDKLDKIVFNLLSNAFKYTPQGRKIQLHIKGSSDSVLIRVSDEGIGIPSEELGKIFDRFYHNRNAKAGQSNGLGLSLVRELTHLHHGTVSVESQPGKGSVFTVEIPLNEANYTEEERSFTPQPSAAASIDPDTEEVVAPSAENEHTLLLVEDNEDLLRLLKDAFSDQYHVLTARNGSEALEVISENQVDSVVSDVMMPELDGLELCRRLKQDVETSHIIVLLLTAKTQTEDRLDAYEAGADDYIPKPFELRVVRSRLDSLLRRRHNLQHEFRHTPGVEISMLEFTPLDQQIMQKAVLVVEEHLSDPDFDVNRLAGELNMSRSSLTRKMRTVCGLSPLEFIRNIRMKYASRMLENKHMTITEVAELSGYNDRKYFTCCFKEEFGITPSEYQKKHGM